MQAIEIESPLSMIYSRRTESMMISKCALHALAMEIMVQPIGLQEGKTTLMVIRDKAHQRSVQLRQVTLKEPNSMTALTLIMARS